MSKTYLEPVEINEDEIKRVMGSRILQKRKANGLTQSELAEIVGLSSQQLSNIENGYSFPRMASFLKMCSYFNTNLDYFFGGKVKTEIPDNLIELLEQLSIEEIKTAWKLLDKYIHRDDDMQI